MISIHAAQEGCDKGKQARQYFLEVISIHAAQEGCDVTAAAAANVLVISIHAAQEGCD